MIPNLLSCVIRLFIVPAKLIGSGFLYGNCCRPTTRVRLSCIDAASGLLLINNCPMTNMMAAKTTASIALAI